jgi:hypothetical protein
VYKLGLFRSFFIEMTKFDQIQFESDLIQNKKKNIIYGLKKILFMAESDMDRSDKIRLIVYLYFMI